MWRAVLVREDGKMRGTLYDGVKSAGRTRGESTCMVIGAADRSLKFVCRRSREEVRPSSECSLSAPLQEERERCLTYASSSALASLPAS